MAASILSKNILKRIAVFKTGPAMIRSYHIWLTLPV
jgi:hypothetical protein